MVTQKEIYARIEDIRRWQRDFKLEPKKEELEGLVKDACDIGHYATAIDLALDFLKDKKLAKKLSKEAFDRLQYRSALSGFVRLNDKVNAKKSVLKHIIETYRTAEENVQLTHHLFDNYNKFWSIFQSKFREWLQQNGMPTNIYYKEGNLTNVANSALFLSREYDVGVPIANGGMIGGYVFSLFDLPILPVETHRDDKSRLVKHLGPDIPERIKDKKVLVIDFDIVTGETARRVYHDLKKYNPASIDLYTVVQPPYPLGNGEESVPKEYGKLFHNGQFSYLFLESAIDVLENKLGK